MRKLVAADRERRKHRQREHIPVTVAQRVLEYAAKHYHSGFKLGVSPVD